MQTSKGKLYCFVGALRPGQLAVVQLLDTVDRKSAAVFLGHLLKIVPYRIHTGLTGRAIGMLLGRKMMARGILFADQPRNRHKAPFTKPNHPSLLSSRANTSAGSGQIHSGTD